MKILDTNNWAKQCYYCKGIRFFYDNQFIQRCCECKQPYK